MFKKILDEIKMLIWICGKGYTSTLKKTVGNEQARKECIEITQVLARTYFPFINEGYFQNYSGLKVEAEELTGVSISEIPLPDSVLGAYVPQKDSGAILINNHIHPVFKLSTLAHEMSHIAVCEYFGNTQPEAETLRVRNRLSLFTEALSDKEEVFADSLISIGTYPRVDFEKIFSKNPSFGFVSLIKAMLHLKKHYPDVMNGFMFSRAFFLNMSFIVHFLRLRIFLHREMGI